MKVKRIIKIICAFLALLTLSSCNPAETADKDKIADLDFTVVDADDLPDIVKERIDEQKKESCKISYSDGDYIYIVIGYGEQPTGGYSIQIDQLYLTKECIVISTTLLGPTEDELVITAATYPYITIKTEDLKLPVCFK